MANELLFAGQYGDAAWSWDTDTKNKASGFANAISSFSFIITLLTAMKCLFVLKPLGVKLQKRDLDVYEAYTNSNNFTDYLQDIRDNIKDIWIEWFDLAVTTAANVGVVPSIRAGPISSSIATMYQPRHHLITKRGQLQFPL